jgi:hypothetical protein
MEVIDIGLTDLEPVSFTLNEGPPSESSFGGGIELLMNDKKRSNTNSVNIDLGDIDRLESDLNELSGNKSSSASTSSSSMFDGTKTISTLASNIFGFSDAPSAKPVVDQGYEKTDSKLGQSTTSSIGNTKTWDGFTKVSDIPPEPTNAWRSNSANMSELAKRRKKREMIKKLEEWREKGQLKHGNHYTMDSNYEEVEDEYETALEEKKRKEGVKLYGWWFLTFVNSLEYANSAFNPFDINLDGWGEQVSEDMESYEDIFSELHEKYKGGKLAPELALLMRLGFSAAVVGISNKALSSATPGFNDVIKQSPELMKMFTNATVQSMSQQSPGFAFANNLMNPDNEIKTSFGPPPKPVETKNQAPPPRPGAMNFTNGPGRPESSNRPDIALSRGAMFRENGQDVGQGYSDINRPNNITMAPSQSRPEMRGPQSVDIDSILSGLKTKTVNIHEQIPSAPGTDIDDSMISVSSLKDMANMGIPKRSNRRKNRSDKNTVSLDI